MRFIDLTGQTFERLVVVARQPTTGRRIRWLCKCVCGNFKDVCGEGLKSQKIRSCGCLKKESIASVNYLHGLSKSKEYKAWSHAKSRCFNVKNKKYKIYGQRGITMCDSWKNSFEQFYKDMGQAPKNHTLDRIDVNGNYEPSNCRWATAKIQSNNTRTNVYCSVFGISGTLKQISEHFNINYKSLHNLYKNKNISLDQAILKLRS